MPQWREMSTTQLKCVDIDLSIHMCWHRAPCFQSACVFFQCAGVVSEEKETLVTQDRHFHSCFQFTHLLHKHSHVSLEFQPEVDSILSVNMSLHFVDHEVAFITRQSNAEHQIKVTRKKINILYWKSRYGVVVSITMNLTRLSLQTLRDDIILQTQHQYALTVDSYW